MAEIHLGINNNTRVVTIMCAKVTGAGALLGTESGRKIVWQALTRSKGYLTFKRYSKESNVQLASLAKRYATQVHARIKADSAPVDTLKQFANEVNAPLMELDSSGIALAQSRLSDIDQLQKRIDLILDSKFVKMTLPVLNALYDSAASSGAVVGTRQEIVEGHIIAIDLSESMDRIVDRDEDLEYLDDYRLMNPYILQVARSMISCGGKDILESFESGFADARIGQSLDEKIQADPKSATESEMTESYKKYRAVMGTAGRNMAAGNSSLGDIFYTGMAHAAECVGCGNELEDSVSRLSLKVPSWSLYDSLHAKNTKDGLAITRLREKSYMDAAYTALKMLPSNTLNKEFLEFLFLSIDHYNLFWHSKAHGVIDKLDYSLREMLCK